MRDLTIIFRTPSQIEADVIKGLLETHGIEVLVTLRSLAHGVSVLARTSCGCRSAKTKPSARSRSSTATATRSARRGSCRSAASSSRSRRIIGYRFRDRGLLEHALTHRSRVHEDASGGVIDNESLEFLGDSILGFVIADMLFREFPQHNEGQKSKLKASIVSATSLGRLGERIGLGRLPDSRARRREDRRPPEAGARRRRLRGADRRDLSRWRHRTGAGVHRAPVRRAIDEARRTGAHATFTEDYKSALQEWLQSHDRGLPVYRLAAEVGPAHRRRFEVEVLVSGQPVARAEGKSKKEAAQAAAKEALTMLNAEC